MATGQGHSIKEVHYPLVCDVCKKKTRVMMTREHLVCMECGLVLDSVSEMDNYEKARSKPYFAIHHFSERLAAFNMTGPVIKDVKFLDRLKEVIQRNEATNPGEKLKGGPAFYSKMIKKVKGLFKHDYSKKKYHERFVFIRDYLGIEKHPTPPDSLLYRLRLRYEVCYRAFRAYQQNERFVGKFVKKRHNIININYLICQFLAQEKQTKYIKYFSFIKGYKTNKRDLERYWKLMKQYVSNIVEYRDDKQHIELLTWDAPDITIEEINSHSFFDK